MRKATARWRYYLLFVAILCTFVLSGPYAYGQASASIVGTVTDPSGAVVPGARVTVTNTATTAFNTATTDAHGFYAVPALSVGTYDVTVSKTGFKEFVSSGVPIHAGQRVTLNAQLAVGATATKVTVSAAAVRVNTATSGRGGVITDNEIKNLSLNGRNFMMLSMLIPGIVSSTGASSLGGGGNTTGQPIIANGGTGGGSGGITFLSDGTWNDNTGCMCGPNVTPSLDTIQEFRVVTNNYSAKYPYSGGGIIMTTTKGGTSQFHGTAYDYVRNDAFDARNFFSPTVPPLKQNIFGFNIGGPVYWPGKIFKNRNKLFFFSSVEWRRIRSGSTARMAAFTPQIRQGNLTSTIAGLSNDVTMPAGGLTLDSGSQAILAQEFPAEAGNIENYCLPPGANGIRTTVNPACFSQASVLYMNQYWPEPNNRAGGFLNYVNNAPTAINQTEQAYRGDYIINQANRLMAVVRYENVPDEPAYNSWGPNVAPVVKAHLGWTSMQSELRWTDTISPTVVNQATVDVTADKPRYHLVGDIEPANLYSQIHLVYPNVDVWGHRMANVNIGGGWNSNSTGNLPVDASDGEVTLQDDFTKVAGAHVIQAGGLVVFGTKKQNFYEQTNGTFNFSGVHTGDPVADYLLGLDSSFYQNSAEFRRYMYYQNYEGYVQDDWKVNRRLTLNLGLRMIHESPEKSIHNTFSSFDPASYSAASAPCVQLNGQLQENSAGQVVNCAGTPVPNYLLNGIVIPEAWPGATIGGVKYTGTSGVGRSIYSVPGILWGPRVGLAYDVFGNGKTAFRAGYGIGWSRDPFGIIYAAVNNPPFVNNVDLLNGTFSDPALGIAGAKSTVGLTDVGAPGQLSHSVEEESYSAGIEQQIRRNMVLDVSYAGDQGHYIDVGYNLNFPEPVMTPTQANPSCLSPGESANPPGGFSFDPCINKGITSSNYTAGPYTGWGSINTSGGASYWGNNNYNALEVSLRYGSSNYNVTVAYTYSRSFYDNAAVQNPRDMKLGYGPNGDNRPNVFVTSYVAKEPWFRNKNGLVGEALGGWTFSGITDIQSGPSVNPGLSTGENGLAGMPNCVGSVSGPRSVAEWFNTAAFTAPAFGYFGNCGAGVIQEPYLNIWNWSLLKEFPITERVKFHLRFEAYNIWNHPSFNGLSTGLGSGNFGQLTSAADPRELEFAARITF